MDALNALPPPLLAVEPGYKNVLRGRQLVTWLALVVAAVALDRLLLSETGVHGLPSTALPILALISLVTAPQRIYSRLRYRLTDRSLQVMRGWLFHTDTIVPLVRVQHLDVVRGPFDKMFGTASLVAISVPANRNWCHMVAGA